MFITGLATGLWIGVSAGFIIAALMMQAKEPDLPCGAPGLSCPRYWEDCPAEKEAEG